MNAYAYPAPKCGFFNKPFGGTLVTVLIRVRIGIHPEGFILKDKFCPCIKFSSFSVPKRTVAAGFSLRFVLTHPEGCGYHPIPPPRQIP